MDYDKAVMLQKLEMLWKLVYGIIILCTATIDISFASSDLTHNDSYECKLGPKTPYRCVANYDDSSLKYSGIL